MALPDPRSLKQQGMITCSGSSGFPVTAIAGRRRREGVAYLGMPTSRAPPIGRAYGYLTGRPGACHRDGQASCTVSRVCQCSAELLPMILIGGRLGPYRGGMGAFQEERQC